MSPKDESHISTQKQVELMHVTLSYQSLALFLSSSEQFHIPIKSLSSAVRQRREEAEWNMTGRR